MRAIVTGVPEATRTVHVWTADTRFLLDRLEEMNAPGGHPLFAGRLDLDRIGVLGHSMGGATAYRAALDDARIKAGINLDGAQFGAPLDRPMGIPFLFVDNETGRDLNAWAYELAEGPAYHVTVKGTEHFSYSDLSLWSPLFQAAGFTGAIDGKRVLHVMNAYTLAFFDQHLRGRPSPLFEAPSPTFPEVVFEKRTPALAGSYH